MADDYLRSIEPLTAIVLGCMRLEKPGARSSHELFIPSLPPAELSKLGLISHMNME
jgi:hypothetical protein